MMRAIGKVSQIVSNKSRNEKIDLYRKRWKNYLPEHKEIEIVDLGCGEGDFMLFLKNEGYNNVQGVEIEVDRAKLANHKSGFDVISKDALVYLTEIETKFDVIAMLNLIEHLELDKVYELFEILLMRLKREGRVFIETPNLASPISGAIAYGDLTHKCFFSPATIAELASRFGFEIIEINEVGPYIHGGVSLIRWISWQAFRAAIYLSLVSSIGDYRNNVFTPSMQVVLQR